MKFCVIIAAGGASARYEAAGGLRSKLDEDLGGKPLLQRTVETFTKFEPREGTISSLIVAGPGKADEFAEFKQRHGDRLGIMGAKLVPGGVSHRWESIKAALAHVPDDCTHVAVHDAARPCVSMDLLDRVFHAAATYDAVIPAVEIADTVKRVEDTGEAMGGADPAAVILGAAPKVPLRVVTETLARAGLMLVQTPQVFATDLIVRAYAQPDLSSTDDAGLVERLGARVVVVTGEARNLKVTVPADVAMARQVLGLREPEGRPVHKRF
ncbi:MAG: 2-C-methyl-D-erythritol 4-phosphate cytidylyltransferase [Phycisphaerae bacterium]|nr:MAG: 2-C-methyl-D-erythritol 4-phosphate cytidylyltransferase [Phycisphaerae bacterium]